MKSLTTIKRGAMCVALACLAAGPVVAQTQGADAPYVRPDVQSYLQAMKDHPRPPMNEATMKMIRSIPPEMISQMMAGSEAPIGTLAVDKSLSMPGPGGKIGLRLFDAKAKRAPGPVVVFFHGGGFVLGSIGSHAALAAELARQLDMPVVSVEYRLAPESRWPAAPDDAEAAARWIAANGKALGREVTGLILSGDSAGGTLTLVTALALRDKPAAVPNILNIPLYPMADASKPYPSSVAFGKGYGLDASDIDFFETSLAADKQSPRHSALLGHLEGLPPTVLATAGLDPLRDGGRAFAQKLVAAGVPVSYYEARGNVHGYATFRKAIPSAQNDLNAIMAMARAMLPK
jgi:acetyl esterase